MSSQLISMYICYNTVHGGWSSWSGWTSCTQSCGSGSQERSRTCTSPPPRYGGRSCVGAARQTQTCNKQACPGKKCKMLYNIFKRLHIPGRYFPTFHTQVSVSFSYHNRKSYELLLMFSFVWRTLSNNWTNLSCNCFDIQLHVSSTLILGFPMGSVIC